MKFLTNSRGILLLMAAVFLLIDCGRKGPPVPPRSTPPPVVKDLAYSVLQDTVQLQWTVPALTSNRDTPFAGCTVHRSVRKPEEAKCQTCPIRFERAADLPVPLISKKGRESRMTFGEVIIPGFNYAYKVICYTQNDRSSEDSNIIQFDH